MKLVFAGTSAFAVPTLNALHSAGHQILAVLTPPARPAGRGRPLRSGAVAQRAQALNLPLHQPLKLDADAQTLLRTLAPDVMIVVAYGLLLPQAVLDIPRLGCLNVHASLLPRWRGAAPVARAIEAGDAETGASIMRMDAGLDTGPVLARARWPITPATTAAVAHDALATLGAKLLVETLPTYANGQIAAQAQPSDGITYAKKLHKDEARLDWSLPAVTLARRVCAFNPAPVAWTELDVERIRIWRASATRADATAAPGTILSADADGVVVATGEHTLRLLELQRPGGRALPASDAARGWNLLGRRFY